MFLSAICHQNTSFPIKKHSRYHTPKITATLSRGIRRSRRELVADLEAVSSHLGDALDSAQLCASPCSKGTGRLAEEIRTGRYTPACFLSASENWGAESSEPCQPLWGHESSMKLQGQHAAAVTGLPRSIANSPGLALAHGECCSQTMSPGDHESLGSGNMRAKCNWGRGPLDCTKVLNVSWEQLALRYPNLCFCWRCCQPSHLHYCYTMVSRLTSAKGSQAAT